MPKSAHISSHPSLNRFHLFFIDLLITSSLLVLTLFPMKSRGSLGPTSLITIQSLADGVKLAKHDKNQTGFSDRFGLPAITLVENLKMKSASINDTLGICACNSVETATALAKPIGQTSLKDANGHRFAVSVVSFDLALQIFTDLQRMMVRDGGPASDGCYARAQKMAFTLEGRGVVVGKIMARGRFKVLNENFKNGFVNWGFHVAPVIVIDDGLGRSVWVLDPLLFSEPVPIESWLALLTENSRSRLAEVFVTNRFVFHPNHKDQRIRNWRPVDMKSAKNLIESSRR